MGELQLPYSHHHIIGFSDTTGKYVERQQMLYKMEIIKTDFRLRNYRCYIMRINSKLIN